MVGGAALQGAFGVKLAVSHGKQDEGGVGGKVLGASLEHQLATHPLKNRLVLGAIPLLPGRKVLLYEVQRGALRPGGDGLRGGQRRRLSHGDGAMEAPRQGALPQAIRRWAMLKAGF